MGLNFKSVLKSHIKQSGSSLKILWPRDFPHGPEVGNLPLSARDVGSMPGQGTTIPPASGQPSPHTAPAGPDSCTQALWSPRAQLERSHTPQLGPGAVTGQWVNKAFKESHDLVRQYPSLLQRTSFAKPDTNLFKKGTCFSFILTKSFEKLLLSNCGVKDDSWEPLDCKEIKPVHPKGNQS